MACRDRSSSLTSLVRFALTSVSCERVGERPQDRDTDWMLVVHAKRERLLEASLGAPARSHRLDARESDERLP